MNENTETKFGIFLDKNQPDMWSFGIALSHWGKETYLYINFFRWCVMIGRLIR